MIDITKPLELADGTPVTFLDVDTLSDRPGLCIVVRINSETNSRRYFDKETGKHKLGGYADLRNKQEPVAPVAALAVPPAPPSAPPPPLDLTKTVETRDGRKVRIVATDRKGASYPVTALVQSSDKSREIIRSYSLDGRHLGNHNRSHLDLVNVEPEEVRFYPVNVHSFLSAEAVKKAYGTAMDVAKVTRKGGKIIAVEAVPTVA